jgi:hypothetical protein
MGPSNKQRGAFVMEHIILPLAWLAIKAISHYATIRWGSPPIDLPFPF